MALAWMAGLKMCSGTEPTCRRDGAFYMRFDPDKLGQN